MLKLVLQRNLKSELHVSHSRGSSFKSRASRSRQIQNASSNHLDSCESSSDEPEPFRSLQQIPQSTEVADLPGFQPDLSSDKEAFPPSSRFSSPTLKRNRSLTSGSQILRKRLQRSCNLNSNSDTRRSSVELSSQQNHSRAGNRGDGYSCYSCHAGDLSRSESMRIAATTKSGYPLCRVFREAELEKGETLGTGFFATAVKVRDKGQ